MKSLWKNINYLKVALTISFAMLLLARCGDDAKNSAITENMAYIKDAYSKKYSDLYIETSGPTLASVPISVTQIDNSRDIAVSVKVGKEELEAYNKKYNKNYVLYPTDLWNLGNGQAIIKKGSAGTTLNITVQPLSDELMNTGNIYVLPVTIVEADGISILNGSETYIYVLKRIPQATVAGFLVADEAKVVKFDMSHLDDRVVFTELTIEYMFKLLTWRNANNYALFYNNDRGEAGGGQIYSRIENGAAGLNKAALEWNIGDGEFLNAYPSKGYFELNKWYHVAMVFGNKEIIVYIDGQIAAKKDVARTQIVAFGHFSNTIKGGFTWVGAGTNSGYTTPPARNETMASEVRLWNVIRTQDQIQENMYRVNPQTPGLMGYWKMDDGAGNTVRDYTGNAGGKTYKWNTSNDESNDLVWYSDQILTVGQ
jgi:hypothetical protein